MTPPEPANDEKPPLWPGLSPRAEVRLRWAFVVAFFVGATAFTLAVLDARHWLAIGITVGVGFLVMLAAGLWRALMSKRS